jgi:hypothetical protein
LQTITGERERTDRLRLAPLQKYEAEHIQSHSLYTVSRLLQIVKLFTKECGKLKAIIVYIIISISNNENNGE